MQTRYWIRRHWEVVCTPERPKHPIGIRNVVQISIVLRPSIVTFELIPLRFLSAYAHAACRIGAPSGGRHQQRIEKAAFPFLRAHQEAAVEQPRAGFVAQVTPILSLVTVNAETAIADLERRRHD